MEKRNLDPQFDRYANSYADLHKNSISISGEEPGYFAAYKADHIAAKLGNEVAGVRSVLDYGCGIGGSISYLRTHFPHARMHGVDVSPASLEQAAQAHPDVVFGLIEDSRVPIPDASIDVAIAACVYHHIPPKERALWTSELRRALRPGGSLFIFEHNPLNPLTQKVVRDCPFDDDAILLSRHESLALVKGAGFHDIDARYIVFFPQALAPLRPAERYLWWLPAGAQYVVHGRA